MQDFNTIPDRSPLEPEADGFSVTLDGVVIRRVLSSDLHRLEAGKTPVLILPLEPMQMTVSSVDVGTRVLALAAHMPALFCARKTYRFECENGAALLHLAFDTKWFEELRRRCELGPDQVPRFIETCRHSDFSFITRMLLDHMTRPDTWPPTVIALCAELIICRFLTELRDQIDETGTRDVLSDAALYDVMAVVEKQLSGPIKVAELARTAAMSNDRFSRAFKAKTGKSPRTYILERRVEMVIELMAETDLSLSDIAFAAGFSSQSHMTYVFNRTIGLPPGQYRGLEAVEDISPLAARRA
ncbi:helix-turn-helix transcriptional regulator [Sulfitobacter sp. S190]|uniref:helix-turn-helix transcriptional regulator n=1 Tax=Sulfitobacter sp. S190 TaxID=2867022 RepID=UPI0021A46094|nr:helix-turn-helix transcriptional regulator [Sulfitobacter sp. S190]UWR23854.1 helix-turn-helix transcriptional regulator [Sulfitobacter sp. S190]